MKKTLEIWMLCLCLPLLSAAPGCIVVQDDDDEEASDESGGMNDDGGDAGDGGGGDAGDGGGGDAGDGGGGDAGDGGGGDAGDGGGPSSDVGEQCTTNDDCDVICLFSGDSDFGFCSVPCDDWSDCPDFWDCVEVDNATLTYCAPG